MSHVTIICEGGLVRAVYDSAGGEEIAADIFDADELSPDWPAPGEIEEARRDWLTRAAELPDDSTARRDVMSWLEGET